MSIIKLNVFYGNQTEENNNNKRTLLESPFTTKYHYFNYDFSCTPERYIIFITYKNLKERNNISNGLCPQINKSVNIKDNCLKLPDIIN